MLRFSTMSLNNSLTFLSKKIKRFLCVKILKRRQKNNNSDLNESITKIFRIMFTLMTLTAKNEISHTVSSKSDIFTFTMYIKAIRDLIWEEM